MSLTFIADGYNVLHKIKECERLSLEQAREVTIQKIKGCCGSMRNKIIIVFDGKEEVIGSSRPDECRIIFSKANKADDVMKALVKNGNPKQMVFITDDNAIRDNVRKSGARVMGVVEFLSPKIKHPRLPKRDREANNSLDKPDINSAQGHSITKDLEQIWIKNASGAKI
jgi:predicted RNA-binding protein with PIN domain